MAVSKHSEGHWGNCSCCLPPGTGHLGAIGALVAAGADDNAVNDVWGEGEGDSVDDCRSNLGCYSLNHKRKENEKKAHRKGLSLYKAS